MCRSSFCEAVVGNDLIHGGHRVLKVGCLSCVWGRRPPPLRIRLTPLCASDRGGAQQPVCRVTVQKASAVILVRSSQDIKFESVGMNAVVRSHGAPKMARRGSSCPSVPCTLGTTF